MMAIFMAAATLACLFPLAGCSDSAGPDPAEEPTRIGSIPSDAVKMTPGTDHYPPVLHSSDYSAPIPMPGPVNTAGVEDAPVISPDGSTFVFFFTPDGNEPAENQVVDGVSGIWWCTWGGMEWTEPVRARLAEAGELHLDGSFALQADTLWFGSIRAGTYRDIDIFTAARSGDDWVDWQNAGARLNVDLAVGELYPTSDGDTIYFGRSEGGLGQNDLWLTVRTGQSWSDPVNLGSPVNTSTDENRPVISPDGRELWFTRLSSSLGYSGPSVFRSIRAGGTWSAPEEVVSNYCGDPGIDAAGNLYFTHLFYDENENKIEADIYVAYRNQDRFRARYSLDVYSPCVLFNGNQSQAVK
ncbi:MAG: hypothetical protein MUF59_08880 [Candidatus Krumholzibacteria bacterium]|nr:hypothetical protein [Candidatus Krumholzibacteria bacterium]